MISILFIVILVYVLFTVAKGLTAKAKPWPLWLRIVNYIAILAIWYYATYPAINIHSVEFWFFVAIALVLGILSFCPPTEKQAVVIEKDGSTIVRVHILLADHHGGILREAYQGDGGAVLGDPGVSVRSDRDH